MKTSRTCTAICGVTPLLLLLVPGAGGCATYQPRPLELEEFTARWRGGEGQIESVNQFLERIAAQHDADDAGRQDAALSFDAADGLTLEEMELAALLLNPDVRVQRAEALVARAGAEHAGLLDDPHFEADVLRILGGVDEPWIVGLGVGFTIPLSGRLGAEVDLAAAEERAAMHRVAAAEITAVELLRSAWIELWSAQLQRQELAQHLERLEPFHATLRELADAGELQPSEARLLSITIERRALQVREIEATIAALELRVKRIAGFAPDAPLELIADAPPLRSGAADVSADDERALLETPAVAAAEADYEAAEEALRREVLKTRPDLTIGPLYEWEEGQSRIGLGLGLPLPVFNANRRGIAEAHARREQHRLEAERAVQDRIGLLAEARLRLEASLDREHRLRSRVIPEADAQISELEQLLELGEVDVVLLTDALETTLDVKLEAIDALQAVQRAANELQSLTSTGAFDHRALREMLEAAE